MPREDVGAVRLDGKELVLADRLGHDLARVKPVAPLPEVEAALKQHAYPWQQL